MSITEWIIVLFILLALIPFWRRLYAIYRTTALQKKGIRTTARVLRLEQTGEQYRKGPVIVLHAEYTTDTEAGLRSSVRGMLTHVQLQTIREGASVEIVYDPDNPSRFALVEGE